MLRASIMALRSRTHMALQSNEVSSHLCGLKSNESASSTPSRKPRCSTHTAAAPAYLQQHKPYTKCQRRSGCDTASEAPGTRTQHQHAARALPEVGHLSQPDTQAHTNVRQKLTSWHTRPSAFKSSNAQLVVVPDVAMHAMGTRPAALSCFIASASTVDWSANLFDTQLWVRGFIHT